MNKDRKRIWWTLFLLIASGIAILIGYYVGTDKGTNNKEDLEKELQAPQITADTYPKDEKTILGEEDGTEQDSKDIIKILSSKDKAVSEDYCAEIEAQVMDFFQYLDTKDYIKRSSDGMGSYERFKNIINRLSSRPPVPAGEGMVSEIMNRNIFHLYRILDGVDIMLIKEILINEADTLEPNLELFYLWLMLGDRCPDKESIHPPQDVIYKYAGFFLNTIGGRSYLFRRPVTFRLLITYYCLIIIYEADKNGLNSYGIDIFPEIEPLIEEIIASPNIQFQSDYVQGLRRIQYYYKEKGRQ